MQQRAADDLTAPAGPDPARSPGEAWPCRPANPLSAARVDRVATRRRDRAWLLEAHGDPGSLGLLVRGTDVAVTDGEPPCAFTAPLPRLLRQLRSGAEPVLLGEADGPLFAVDVSDASEDSISAVLSGRGRLANLRDVGPLLPRDDGGLLSHAVALGQWHRRHRYCGACGSPTSSHEAGHVRRCEGRDCQTLHFPRTDPAVIMLVTDGRRCLLGRQARWPQRRYSCLAGFVEPGESLEDAVAREVAEETGVTVRGLRYQSSQPWPFPSSLMLGFRALAEPAPVHLTDGELQDARWFTAADLRAQLRSGQVLLPSPVSIAWRLITDWLDEQAG